MENINKFISSIDNSTPNKIRQSKSDAEFRRYLRENYCKQLNLTIVSQQRELLKVLEYTRQIKNNPKDIQLIVDKLYVENL